MTTATQILTKAAGHITSRAGTYDQPEGERSAAQTVAIFNLFHGTSLTEAQGWHFLQILKDVRLFSKDDYHADSGEDCVSYAALKAEAKARQLTQKATAPAHPDYPHLKEVADHMNAQAALRKAQEDAAEGWIEWEGGDCPVPRGTLVSIKARGGFPPKTHKAEQVDWGHIGFRSDIIAYRIAKEGQ